MESVPLDDLLGPEVRQGDTCDRCGPGTVALVAFRLPSGGRLTFCNHHARRHTKKLAALGAVASANWPMPETKEVP